MSIETKKCTCCKTIKPKQSFSPRTDRPCGVMAHCKSCAAEKTRAYRKTEKGLNAARASEAKYAASEKGRKTSLVKLENQKRSEKAKLRRFHYIRTERGRLMNKVKTARYRLKNPDKERSRYLLKLAIGSGKIQRLPCVICGNEKSEGHHEDYSKPLEVVWLCKLHHTEHHIYLNQRRA